MLVAGITGFCVWRWRRNRMWMALWMYYVITLVPVLGIIQVGGQPAADRYMYLPSLGIFVLACGSLQYMYEGVKKTWTGSVSAVIIIIPFFLATLLCAKAAYDQIKTWKDPLTIWNREVTLFPDFYRGYRKRGQAYSSLDNHKQAIHDFDRSIDLNPFCEECLVDRGITYADMGKYQQAIQDFNWAIKISHDYVDAFINRGIANLMLGDYQKAILDLTTAMQLDPEDNRIYGERIMAYKLAVRELTKSIRHKPGQYDLYMNRGVSFAMIGEFGKAIEDFESAISIDPDLSVAYYNRGLAYERIGSLQQALRDFQEAAARGDERARKYLSARGMSWDDD
jgi:tetratricopeptide (TPR) repeat protein